MALSFLLDTSVLKRLGQAEVRSVVEPLAAARQLGRPSICDLEVGYSARNGDEWDCVVEALDVFDRVETTAAHLGRALQVQRLLAAQPARAQDPGLARALSHLRRAAQPRLTPGFLSKVPQYDTPPRPLLRETPGRVVDLGAGVGVGVGPVYLRAMRCRGERRWRDRRRR